MKHSTTRWCNIIITHCSLLLPVACADAHSLTLTHAIFLSCLPHTVTAARPMFSRVLHTSHKDSKAKLDSAYTLLGNTGSYPYLATPDLPGNTATHRVKVEGSNYVTLGAMRNSEAGGMDLEKWMHDNENAWGFPLHCRSTYIAGNQLYEGRKAGPEEFPVPVTLDITIDASVGTIAAAVVGGEDLALSSVA